MKFYIVSDSSCDLGLDEAQRLGIGLVSFYAALGDETYHREERNLSTHAFYQRMAEHPGVFPKTSTPTLSDYLDAFLPAVAQGLPILCICINSTYSASFQTACNARAELLEDYPDARIHVMDSQLVTVLQGEFVREAVLLRDMGYTLEEAVSVLEPIRDSGRIFFTTNDLDYLRNGGRIGRAAAATGTVLNVKPIIGYHRCELFSNGIAQGRKKSLLKVQNLLLRCVEQQNLDLTQWRIVTGFGLDRAECDLFTAQLFDELAQKGYALPPPEPYQIGVTIGVHTGPTPIGAGLLRRAIVP